MSSPGFIDHLTVGVNGHLWDVLNEDPTLEDRPENLTPVAASQPSSSRSLSLTIRELTVRKFRPPRVSTS